MRPALALLFAATTWATTCRDAAPCEVISPTRNVFLAEVLEAKIAQKSNADPTPLVPVRMKTIASFYGKPPSGEFVYHVWTTIDLRAGDQFYIEEDSYWQQALRSTPCGYSGPFTPSVHQPRIDFFRKLTAANPPGASLKIWVHSNSAGSLSGATVQLAGPRLAEEQQTGPKGEVEWTDLPAGQYTISANRDNYSVAEPATALAPIRLLPGACANRSIPMKPRFSISGRAQTSDGAPAAKLKIKAETLTGRMAALPATTNEAGEFTFPSIDAGQFVLFAGGGWGFEGSPYPLTWHPGVPSKELAQVVAVDDARPHPIVQFTLLVQFTLPRPSPSRELTLQIQMSPEAAKVQSGSPMLIADPGLVYSQTWSPDTGILSAVVTATKPIKFRVGTVFPPRAGRSIESSEIEIAPGETNLSLPVQLHLVR